MVWCGWGVVLPAIRSVLRGQLSPPGGLAREMPSQPSCTLTLACTACLRPAAGGRADWGARRPAVRGVRHARQGALTACTLRACCLDGGGALCTVLLPRREAFRQLQLAWCACGCLLVSKTQSPCSTTCNAPTLLNPCRACFRRCCVRATCLGGTMTRGPSPRLPSRCGTLACI